MFTFCSSVTKIRAFENYTDIRVVVAIFLIALSKVQYLAENDYFGYTYYTLNNLTSDEFLFH